MLLFDSTEAREKKGGDGTEKAGKPAVGMNGRKAFGETAGAEGMPGRMLLEKSASKTNDVWEKRIIGRKRPVTASSFSGKENRGRKDGVFRWERMSRGAHIRAPEKGKRPVGTAVRALSKEGMLCRDVLLGCVSDVACGLGPPALLDAADDA